MKQTRHNAYLPYLALFGLLLALYLLTLAPTVTTRYGGVDGGELAAAAVQGGVPHPPGYPSYLLLARSALLVPAGEPAWRLGLLSALSMAGAAALLAGAVHQLRVSSSEFRDQRQQRERSEGGPASNHGLLSGLLPLSTGLLFGLDPLPWSQAIIAEVYAPALLALSTLLWLAARWSRHGCSSTLAAAGLLLGLGAGLHLTLLALLPAAGLALLAGGRRPTPRQAAAALALFAAGLSCFGLLAWLPQLGAPGWGDTGSLAGLLSHVLAREYAPLVGATSWNERLGRLSASAAGLLAGQGPWGLALGCWGLALLARQRRALLGLTGGLALSSLGWALTYGGEHAQVYLLPLHACWALWAGLGLADLGRRAEGPGRLLPPLLLLLPLLLLSWRAPALSLRHATSDRLLAEQRLASLPHQAVLLSAADAETFPLWYVQRALSQRPDVQVVDLRLWERPWYRRQLGPPETGDPRAWARARQRPLYATPGVRVLLPGTWIGDGLLWRAR